MKRSVKKVTKNTKDQSKRYKLIVLLFSTLIVAIVVWVMMQGKSFADFRSQAAYKKDSMCSFTWDPNIQPLICRNRPVGSIVIKDGKSIRCVKKGKNIDLRGYPICYTPNASGVLPRQASEGQIMAQIVAPESYTYETPKFNAKFVYGFGVPNAYKYKPSEYISNMKVFYDKGCTNDLDTPDNKMTTDYGNLRNEIRISGKDISSRSEIPFSIINNFNYKDNDDGYKCLLFMRVEVNLKNSKVIQRKDVSKIFYVRPIIPFNPTSNPQPENY